MTFTDNTNKLKFDRSLAINATTSLYNSKGTILGFDNWNKYYLSGDTLTPQNFGINDLIYYYIKEKYCLVGDSFNYPFIVLSDSLSQWRAKWDTIQTNATSAYGDGIYGLFPPNTYGAAASTMNMNSNFLNNQGGVHAWYGDALYGDTMGGMYGRINQVLKELGDSATAAKGVFTSAGTYADSAIARIAANLYVYGDSAVSTRPLMTNRTLTGLGIEGRRTCADTIYFYNTIVGGPFNYRVGTALIKTTITNFYGDSTDANGFLGGERTRFLSALSGLIAFADTTTGPYFRMLKNLRAQIIHIRGDSAGDTNAIFKSPPMWKDVGDSKDYLSFYMSKLAGVIGVVADSYGKGTAADSSIYGCYRYFNALTGGTGEAADYRFQQALFTLRSKLKFRNNLDALQRGCSWRYWTIERILGNAGTSPTRLRKWRHYWLNTRIGKPVSTLVSYNGIDFAITSSINQKNVVENSMAQLLGSNQASYFQYIPTPTTYATYLDPIRDAVTGQILQRRVTTIFSGQTHATSYWIYKQQSPSPSSSVIDGIIGWGDTMGDTYHYATITALDNKTGFVKTYYTDDVISTGDSVEIFSLNNSLNISSFGRAPTINNIVLEPGKIGKTLNPILRWGGTSVVGIWQATTNYIDHSTCTDALNAPHVTGTTPAANSNATFAIDTTRQALDNFACYRLSLTTTGTDGYAFFTPNDTTDLCGVVSPTMSISAEVFVESGSIQLNECKALCFGEYFGGAWTDYTVSPTLFDTWHKVFVKVVLNVGTTGIRLYPLILNTAADGEFFRIRNLQFESTPYSSYSAYVNGTRGAGGLYYKYDFKQQGTIEGWIKPAFEHDNNGQKVIFTDADGSNIGIFFWYDGTTRIYSVAFFGTGGLSKILESSPYINTPQLQHWTYFKIYWNANNGTLGMLIKNFAYSDKIDSGKLASGAILFTNYISFGSLPLYTAPDGFEWNGYLTDFAIYPYVNMDMSLYNRGTPHIPTFAQSLGYIYRVKIIDETNKVNGDTTASFQSPLHVAEGDSFYRVMADSIISFGHKPIFTRGQAAVIKNTVSHNGYYQITNVGDSFANIYPTIAASDSIGLIYPSSSIAFVQ